MIDAVYITAIELICDLSRCIDQQADVVQISGRARAGIRDPLNPGLCAYLALAQRFGDDGASAGTQYR